MKAWEMFEKNPEKWIQGCKARDSSNMPVSPRDMDATRFCLLGVLEHGYGLEHGKARADFKDANPGHWNIYTIVDWKDDPDMTVEEVIEALKRADL